MGSCPAQRKPKPRSSIPLEKCQGLGGRVGLGGARASASSLIPTSPRKVVTLEKKAEETFGFEIQVGAMPSCVMPCRAVPCHAALPTLLARTLLCIKGIFKLSLSQGLFLAVTELPGY